MEENQNMPDDSIKISQEEAMSERVDDFISRQKSLTGEPGIGKEKTGSRWYLQNWFLFGVAGAIAAFVVWAFTEPYYNDYYYLQGEIQSLDLSEAIPATMDVGLNYSFKTNIDGKGWIMVNDQRIWLANFVQEYTEQGKSLLNSEDLYEGREIGVYIYFQNYISFSDLEGLAVASYVNLSPKAESKEIIQSLAVQNKTNSLLNNLLFPLIAGAIGLAIGIIEGLICRLWRRALYVGIVSFLVGFIGGYLVGIPTDIIYGLMSKLADNQREAGGSFAFFIQMGGRALSWGITGLAMGLGQGLALRSRRLITYGIIGGVVGGLLGGLFFDPISEMVSGARLDADLSRMIGFTVIGLTVGVMMGLVQLLARDVWLRMTEGPLAGKEFLFFKDVMNIGSSPKSEIYLFNDAHVLPKHATIRTIGEECQIESLSRDKQVMVNDRTVKSARLKHGDRIRIGRTSFIFQMKQS